MPSIKDLAPVAVFAELRGRKVPVRGLSIEQITSLVAQHPNLADVVDKFKLEGLSLPEAFRSCQSLIPVILATGIGEGDDQDAVDFCGSQLSIGEQYALFAKIAEATFPFGFGQIADALIAMKSVADALGLSVQVKTEPETPSDAS